MDNELIKSCEAKAEAWLSSSVYDAATQAEVRKMLDNADKTELVESFYQNLEFGTGGLRGIMGVGTNRMNIYTVGAATQGLSNYLNKNFKDLKEIAVVVGHDCRNNSRLFAEVYFCRKWHKGIFVRRHASYSGNVVCYSPVGLPKWNHPYGFPQSERI